ncbi:hypothetical protein AAG906_017260 [Vitis piasezkii]
MDVKTAFLNGNLDECIYMIQPDNFITKRQEHMVYHKNRKLALFQAAYIDKLLVKYVMQNSKKSLLLFKHGIPISQYYCPKTPKEKECMQAIPYASVVGSLMYVMLCTRLDICFVVGMRCNVLRVSGKMLG